MLLNPTLFIYQHIHLKSNSDLKEYWKSKENEEENVSSNKLYSIRSIYRFVLFVDYVINDSEFSDPLFIKTHCLFGT